VSKRKAKPTPETPRESESLCDEIESGGGEDENPLLVMLRAFNERFYKNYSNQLRASEKQKSASKIDYQLLEYLGMLNCSVSATAKVLGIHRSTFYAKKTPPTKEKPNPDYDEKFADCYERGLANHEFLIRSGQLYKAVVLLSDTQLIWLGKQGLKQRDPPTAEPSRREDESVEDMETKVNSALQEYMKQATFQPMGDR
jgi:hypothetical protein